MRAGTDTKPVFIIPEQYRTKMVRRPDQQPEAIKPTLAPTPDGVYTGEVIYQDVGKPNPLKPHEMATNVDDFLDKSGLRVKLWEAYLDNFPSVAPAVAQLELRRANEAAQQLETQR